MVRSDLFERERLKWGRTWTYRAGGFDVDSGLRSEANGWRRCELLADRQREDE